MTMEASMPGEIRWYPSKVDWWLVPLLCLPPVAAVVVCAAFALAGRTTDLWIALAMAAGVVALYGGLVLPMRYGLDDSDLHVRFGLCRQRIPLADIVEVHPTRNPLSSPALSLDRLNVRFGPGIFKAVMISPAEQDRFLDDLSHRTGLKREGNRLSRG